MYPFYADKNSTDPLGQHLKIEYSNFSDNNLKRFLFYLRRGNQSYRKALLH